MCDRVAELIHVAPERELDPASVAPLRSQLELVALVSEGNIGLLAREYRVDKSLIEIQHQKFLLGI